MEALVAVGLAGNVMQFVQFSSKLISIAAEIKKKGGPSSLPELQTLSKSLTQQAEIIATRLEGSKKPYEKEEQVGYQLSAPTSR